MDEVLEKEIIQYLRSIKFGNIRIELNETFPHVDIVTENRKRFMKKSRRKKLYKTNIIHKD